MAFVVAFKRHRKNSVLYHHDKKYILAQKLGMSPVTIGKYIARCEDLGLIVPHHSDRKFVKITTAIVTLFPNEPFKKFQHVRFFSGEVPLTQHRQIVEVIKFALALANFKRQEYNISRKALIDQLGSNRIHKGSLKQLRKLAKQHSCEISALPRICQRTNQILTGKFHLSNIIGCSPGTASKLLRQWDKLGIISRTVVTQQIKAPVSHATYDHFRSTGCKYLVPLKNGTGYFNTLGTTLTYQ